MGHVEEIYSTVPRFDFVRTGPYGPSDEAITDYINNYLDPQRTQEHLHSQWRNAILRGRDNFHGLLTRHHRTPLHSEHVYPCLRPDPPSRTEVRTRSQTYDSFVPSNQFRLGSGSAVRSFEGLFLGPTGRIGSRPDYHLLSMEMAGGHVIPWAPGDLNVQGELRWVPGQTEWTRHIMGRFGPKLTELEIFGGVTLALFRYTWDPIILQAMATNWNYVDNTFVLEDRNATIDLNQMVRLLGVPAAGLFYEERVPPDRELYGMDSHRDFYHQDSLRTVFAIYYEISMIRSAQGLSRDVPFKDWVGYFMDKVPREKATGFAEPLENL